MDITNQGAHMKTLQKFSILIFTLLLSMASGYADQQKSADGNGGAPTMLKRVMPAIVNIAARGDIPYSPNNRDDQPIVQRFEDSGSGVIIDAKNGYIVTNVHVIKNSESITVTLQDGRSMVAKTVGIDIPSDVAVIKINAKRLKEIKFGDSDKIQIGDPVSAIGSPFGLRQTVTSGVVSALERIAYGITGLNSWIQTDAPINPGSSGGALVNTSGEVIGINTAIISPNPNPNQIPTNLGIGLAIPSNTVKSVVEQLIKYGEVRRGIIGILVQDITPALAEAMKLKDGTRGAIISQVVENTPAAKAGLKKQDIIIKINHKPVHSAVQISNAFSLAPIDSEIILEIQRLGKIMKLKAKVASPDTLQKIARESQKMLLAGIGLADFKQLLDNQLIKGVEVLDIDDSSIAYSCGLRRGDVILTAANQSVATLAELQEIAKKNNKQLLLELKRPFAGNIFLVLEE